MSTFYMRNDGLDFFMFAFLRREYLFAFAAIWSLAILWFKGHAFVLDENAQKIADEAAKSSTCIPIGEGENCW